MYQGRSVVFISAFVGSDGSKHDALDNALGQLGLERYLVLGSYKGQKELSFMVMSNSGYEFIKICELAREFNQESILLKKPFGDSYLYFVQKREGASDYIGMMKEISGEEIDKHENYSYVHHLNKYFICE